MKPQISVIILNYNGKKFLLDCLNSVFKQSYNNFEVIFVDNASKDGSVKFVNDKFSKYIKNKKLKIIINKENEGFAEGNNIAVRQAKSRYIALLNIDTTVHKDWLIEMVKFMCKDKKIAIVGSYVNNLVTWDTYGNLMNIFGEPVDYNIGKDKTFTFMVSGCSMLFDKEKVGLPFDKDWFAYGEDAYTSWKARLNGFKIVIAPKSKLNHFEGGVRKKNPAVRSLLEFHGEKNRIMNILIFYELENLIKILPLVISSILLTIFISLFRFKLLTRLKSYLWIIKNWSSIIEKRKSIQLKRKVSDKEIFKYMTYRIPYKLHGLEKIFNGAILIYCWITHIPVR